MIAQQEFKLLVTTYNLRNLADRYSERKGILRRTIQEQNADLLCLQEVSFESPNQVDELVENGNIKYSQHHAETQLKFHDIPGVPSEMKLDGNSILVNQSAQPALQILQQKSLHLSGFRVAQAMNISYSSEKVSSAETSSSHDSFWLVNTHLHHTIPDSLIRFHQLQQLHLWLLTITDYLNSDIIFCGDLNLTPKEYTYEYITNNMGFKSSYAQVHQKEPEFTFPTGLQAPNMDTDPAGCFDYIWYKGKHITPIDVKIFGDKALETDSTIYPSDHMGLTAELAFNFN